MSARLADVIQLTGGEVNTVDDEFPGGGQESPGFAPGQPGAIYPVNFDTPAAAAAAAIGQLFADGEVMYVKVKSDATTAPAKGLIAYWSDKDAYEVTPDDPSKPGDIAGIFMNAITKGQYGFIKISGRAEVKFKSSTTKTTPVVGDTAVSGGGTGLADVLADATNPTFGTTASDISRVIGELLTAVSSQIATVQLRFNQRR